MVKRTEGKADREKRMAQFARLLKRLRKSEKKMTQQALAEATGLSHGYIGFLEQERELPSRAVVERLAEALGADPQEMLAAAGFIDLSGFHPHSSVTDTDVAAEEGGVATETGQPEDDPEDPHPDGRRGGRRAGLSQVPLQGQTLCFQEPERLRGEAIKTDEETLEKRVNWALRAIMQDDEYVLLENWEELPLKVRVALVMQYERRYGVTLLSIPQGWALNKLMRSGKVTEAAEYEVASTEAPQHAE